MPEPDTAHEAVLTSRDGHVLVVTINRPAARNAVNLAVALGVGKALQAADRDRTVRVVILTGAGTEAFCAGADLKAVSRGESVIPEQEPARSWGFAGYVNHHLSTPTIAAVEGFALGGGTELVLASDLVVASETALFGLPEVRRGLIAGAGGAFRLAQQVPAKLAAELLLTGATISAARAFELGLVNRVVPAGQALEQALELAAVICANAPVAVQATKRLTARLVNGTVPGESELWALTNAEMQTVLASADLAEGMEAFAQRRQPVWTGC